MITVLKIIVAVVLVLFVIGCGLFALALGKAIVEQERYNIDKKEGGDDGKDD